MNTLEVRNMDVNVDLNNTISIIGPSNSGKSYLLKKCVILYLMKMYLLMIYVFVIMTYLF